MSVKRVAIVLSGGAGTRLWPISTDARPKQFMTLFNGRSLYQDTLLRLGAAKFEAVYVIGNQTHCDLLTQQARELALPPLHFIFEPLRRDSGAAIAAGVAAIRGHLGDDTVIFALPSDHLITDQAAFGLNADLAHQLAELDFLTTFGIIPSYPSSEFGYIQRGGRIDQHANAFRVLRFHEKPERQAAERYLFEGGFYWNSGIFAFSAASFNTEARRHMPELWHIVSEAVERGQHKGQELYLDAERFGAAPRISIDYALMEKSARVGVIPASFPWSDVGTWSVIHDLKAEGADNNLLVGDVSTKAVANSVIIAEGVKVLAVGVDGLVIAATKEGVFVAPQTMAAQVKNLLEHKG